MKKIFISLSIAILLFSSVHHSVYANPALVLLSQVARKEVQKIITAVAVKQGAKFANKKVAKKVAKNYVYKKDGNVTWVDFKKTGVKSISRDPNVKGYQKWVLDGSKALGFATSVISLMSLTQSEMEESQDSKTKINYTDTKENFETELDFYDGSQTVVGSDWWYYEIQGNIQEKYFKNPGGNFYVYGTGAQLVLKYLNELGNIVTKSFLIQDLLPDTVNVKYDENERAFIISGQWPYGADRTYKENTAEGTNEDLVKIEDELIVGDIDVLTPENPITQNDDEVIIWIPDPAPNSGQDPFDLIVQNPNIITVPDPSIIEVPNTDPLIDLDGNPVPDTGTNPNPDPGTNPNPDPGTNPNPDPGTNPPPDDWTIPEETPSLDFTPFINALGDIKRKFPFSIPWDLKAQLNVFDVQPKTPEFVIDISKFPGAKEGSTFKISLSAFDPLATAARWALTIAVDIGFILMLRRLMPE